MNITTKYLCLVLFLAGCFQITATQSSFAQSDNKAFRHFTPQDGFPSYVYRMAQGPKGQIWMTGPSGLMKFDGYTVHTFIHDPGDEYSVPEGLIMEILTDYNGRIWLSGSSGVSYLDPRAERFHQVSIPDSIPPVSNFPSLLETSDHSIWTTGNGGLYRFSQPTPNQPDPDVRFYPYDFSEAEEVNAFYLAEVSNEFIWLTSNQGLIQFDRTTESYTKTDPLSGLNTDLEITRLTPILRDTKSNIWLGVDGGLIFFREGTNNPEIITSLGKDNFDLSNTTITALDPAEDGGVFIGISDQGLLHYNVSADQVVQYTRQQSSQDGLSENTVYDILEDMDGNLWMGHPSTGMSMMYEKNWTYSYYQIFDTEGTNARSEIIHDLAEDQNSNLWLGTSRGIAFVPADGSAYSLYPPDPDVPSSNFSENNITNIQLSGDAILAVESNGDETSTFYIFDIQQKQFSPINLPDSLTRFSFDEIVASESVIYWAARGSSQLVALHKDDLSIETFDLPLDYPMRDNTAERDVEAQPILTRSGDLYILYKHAPPNIFVTTDWSYFNFDTSQGSFTRVPMNTNRDLRKYVSPETQFPSVVEEAVIWSKAQNGLLKENLKDGTHTYFPLSLNSNELTFGAGLQASDGSIWFAGVTGAIRKFDPQSKKVNTYSPELSRKPTFIFFTFELSNGSHLFGGSGGYIQFDPEEVREEVDLQHLHITDFRTGSESMPIVDPDEHYEIDFENNNISFSYLGINYRSPDNQYRYRILGYNDEWVDMGTQRSIFLANLPFGDYTFQVQAATPGSSFSDESILSEVSFAILPPWWRTIPAYVTYFLLFAGFVFGADRFQRKRVIQKERERATAKELAQAKEIEKAYQNLEVAHKDLEQAHSNLKSAQDQLIQQEKLASLGQLTAGIAHEIKNPLNFVNNFSELSVELVEEARDEVIRSEAKNREAKRQKAEVKKEAEKTPLSRGESEGEAGARGVSDGAKDGDQPQNSETDSSFSNTPLNPLSRGDAGSSPQMDLILEILDDIESNLKTIHKHGSRADSIVKSMLQHSRGGDGKMEPTPLNPLIKEYVNLAFHGMRAGNDPINVDIALQLDENVGEVPLVAEDFSRVILNITNNAFDAMKDKARLEAGKSESFLPKLIVRTKRNGDTIAVEFRDNGPGIPEAIKEKILQPFFTTKKGTEGTGLGLSITNDIVKAHGGSLNIESFSGEESTVFIIHIPCS